MSSRLGIASGWRSRQATSHTLIPSRTPAMTLDKTTFWRLPSNKGLTAQAPAGEKKRPEKMRKEGIPEEIKKQVQEIVQDFNERVIGDPNYYYIPRYRGNYLYLDRFDYGRVGPVCRLKYKGGLNKWEFAIFKYSDERYDPDEWFFPGSGHVNGTIQGTMRAGRSLPIAER